MSAKRRLAVLASGIWTALVAFTAALDSQFNWFWFWFAAITPVGLAWGSWWVWAGFREQASTDPKPPALSELQAKRYDGSTFAYLLAAWLFGVVIASVQHFPPGTAQWFGASIAPVLFGALLGAIVRMFRKRRRTNFAQWAFWWSFIALVIEGINQR